MGYNQLPMTARWLLICVLLLAPWSTALAQDTHLPAETVAAHFQAILAEEYTAADEYFSAAFRRAFKTERRSQVDQYYLARRDQLASGYNLLDTRMLADADQTTAVVVVEFQDPRPDAFLAITERMYYYLIYEKVEAGAPLVNRDGRAWRIDIFDALSYDTLAEARRRPYLYTREAWPEDEGFQLISLQGLFRIQDALESFYRDNGQYPFRLLGSDNRRDELIVGGYLLGRYPDNGFNGGAMRMREFGLKSSGDFAYYSVDADSDGWREGYWLLLHGKVPQDFIFAGYDTIHILSNLTSGSQFDQAQLFAQFWQSRAGQALEVSAGVAAESLLPPAELVPAPGPKTPTAAEEEPVTIGQPLEDAQQITPLEPGAAAAGQPAEPPAVPSIRELLAVACGRLLSQQIRQQGQLLQGEAMASGGEPGDEEPGSTEAPQDRDSLTVYGFGW
jgi:hypothetical protein